MGLVLGLDEAEEEVLADFLDDELKVCRSLPRSPILDVLMPRYTTVWIGALGVLCFSFYSGLHMRGMLIESR